MAGKQIKDTIHAKGPDEEFDQGPLLAVYELSARFL